MANEIDKKIGLTISKNGATYSMVGNTKSNLTGDVVFANVQIVGFGGSEPVVFSDDIIAVGIKVIGFKNLSTARTLTFSNGLILGPGEAHVFTPDVDAEEDPSLTAQSETAECHLQILAAGP
jgi:hypothetical protein